MAADLDSARLQRAVELGLDESILREWACRCAEHVLPLFAEKAPNDLRPRRAIEAARLRLRGLSELADLERPAAAARAAADEQDLAAPRSAARAAASAAHPQIQHAVPVFAAQDAQAAAAAGSKAARRIEARWQVEALIEVLLEQPTYQTQASVNELATGRRSVSGRDPAHSHY